MKKFTLIFPTRTKKYALSAIVSFVILVFTINCAMNLGANASFDSNDSSTCESSVYFANGNDPYTFYICTDDLPGHPTLVELPNYNNSSQDEDDEPQSAATASTEVSGNSNKNN